MPRPKPESLEAIARRERWTAEDARIFVEAGRRSGMSLREFAASHSIDAQRLYRWSRELRVVDERVEFAEVAIARSSEASADGRIEVELRSGDTIRVGADFDTAALRRLLSVLDERR